MTSAMTPDGVTIKHPDKLFIGGEWVVPHGTAMIEIESPVSETWTWTAPWPPPAMLSITAPGPAPRRWNAWPT
jgi:hypothetical protein